MPIEEAKKDNTKIMVIGGVIIIVTAAGVYYIYSRNALINEYLKLVIDYEREYKEFGADGEIDEDEAAILENKRRAMETLEKEIEDKGLIPNILIELGKLGIIATIGYVTISVIKYIMRRWPPKPPNFICPECGKDLHTDHRLKRHLEKEHPEKKPSEDSARDAWDYLVELPQWLIDLISSWGPVEIVQKRWDEWDAPLDVKIAAIIAVVAWCIVIIIVAWWLGPLLIPFIEKVGYAIPALA